LPCFEKIFHRLLIVCAAVALLGGTCDVRATDAGGPGSQAAGQTPDANTSIEDLIRETDQAVKNRDYSSSAQLLEKVVAVDPKYKNAWNYLGWTYNQLGQYEKAEAALRQAIAVDAKDTRAYNNLGQSLTAQKKYDEAIVQYQKQIEINPKDPWAHANLGRVYGLTKQYDKAVYELEKATAITPDDPGTAFNLGHAYAKANNAKEATKALERAVQLRPVPTILNSVAYELANDNLDLPQAAKFAQAAIAATVLQMRDATVEHVTREDLNHTTRIAAYWDTWGWVRFRQGDVGEAENYVRCAWLVRPISIIGDHLGQIYEKQGRKAEALRTYQMVLASDAAADETRERLKALAGPEANADTLIEEGKKLLKESMSIRVGDAHQVEGFAEFWIVLSPGPTVRGVKFVNGDEELKPFEKDLEAVAYPNSFPEATELKLLRRARLVCTHAEGDCRLQMISAPNVPTDDVAATTPVVAGEAGRIHKEPNAAKLLKRVQPAYPPAARLEGVQGAVVLSVIIGKDGSIGQIKVVSGDPLLQQAAIDAVRQWVYEPTLVNGAPVEVDTQITVIFQLNGR
jgi:TonB family protein